MSDDLLIRRLAEIQDELNSRELNDLIAEKEKIRTELKARMLIDNKTYQYDEVSNYEALITTPCSDNWNIEKLRPLLTNSTAQTLAITEAVNSDGIDELIKMGIITRHTLERYGAVTKRERSKTLIVREKKENGLTEL